MKKFVLFILAVAALCSCSNDETVTDMPVDGQYIAETPEMVLSMDIENGKCTCFSPFVYYMLSGIWDNVSTSGEYPDYVYLVEGLTITAHFESSTAFTATLDGGISDADFPGNQIDGVQSSFENYTISFKLDNRILDANGDAVLDTPQPNSASK